MSMLADVAMIGHDKVGSFALARDKRTMLANGLGAWLNAIFAVWNRHALPRLWELNGWPMDRMCRIGHGDIQSENIEALAHAAQMLAQSGMELFPDPRLENHIRSEAGWPEKVIDTGLWDPNDPLAPNPEQTGPMGNEPPEQTDEQVDAKTIIQPPGGTPAAGAPSKPGAPPSKPSKPAGNPFKKFKDQARSRRGTYHQRTGTLSTALELLRDRARVGSGDQVAHGFKTAEAPLNPKKDMAAAIDSAPVERVRIRDLVATQPTVRRDHVRAFLENPGIVIPGQRSLSGEKEDKPVIVRQGNNHFIHDGHHRLAAKLLLGQEDTMARVIDVPEPS